MGHASNRVSLGALVRIDILCLKESCSPVLLSHRLGPIKSPCSDTLAPLVPARMREREFERERRRDSLEDQVRRAQTEVDRHKYDMLESRRIEEYKRIRKREAENRHLGHDFGRYDKERQGFDEEASLARPGSKYSRTSYTPKYTGWKDEDEYRGDLSLIPAIPRSYDACRRPYEYYESDPMSGIRVRGHDEKLQVGRREPTGSQNGIGERSTRFARAIE